MLPSKELPENNWERSLSIDMKKVLWQEMRRTEFEQAVKADAVVIIPVGSVEQHGNHLPVGTDAIGCFTIAQRAAEAIDEFPVLVSPIIWAGYSPMHMAYPGTITLKFNTLVNLLTDVAVCIYAHGFRKIFFLNGHSGNEFIMKALRSKLASEEHVPSVVGYSWWGISQVYEEMQKICQSDEGAIGHAGEVETSMQLYLRPELVHADATAWVRGVWGDPSTGTRDKGERLVTAAVDALVKVLREYHSGELDARTLSGREVFEGQKTVDSVFVREYMGRR